MMGMTDWRSNHRPERWSAPLIRNATDAAEAWWKALPDGYKCKPHEVRLLAAIDVLRRLPTDDPLTVEDNDGQPCEVANAKTEDLLKAFSTDNKQAIADPTVYGEGFACLSAAAAGLGFPEPPPEPPGPNSAAESAISDEGEIVKSPDWPRHTPRAVRGMLPSKDGVHMDLDPDGMWVHLSDCSRWRTDIARKIGALLSRSARQVVLPERSYEDNVTGRVWNAALDAVATLNAGATEARK